MRELEATVQELTRQLHQGRVKAIVDLRVAGGLISADQRRKSMTSSAKLNDAVLEVVRKELVEIIVHMNKPTGEGTPSLGRYIQ
jgi:signal recognition particle GTPase